MRSVRAASVATAAGAVVLPTGLALAVPHLSVDGLGLTGVVGAALTAVGGVLLVGGAVVLVRALRRWWRLVAVPAALVVLYVVCVPVASAVYATTSPRRDLGSSTPAAHGLAYDDVRFPTADGVELSGWYVPSRNGAAVALLHGASSTRSNVLAHAVVLARHGYGVLLFDARGHGRSEGRAMELGWWGDADVAAAVRFLAAQPGVDQRRIGAVGMSMGGEEAVGALAAVPGLRAVVGEGVTARTVDDKDWYPEAFGVRGWVTQQVDRLTYGLADLLTSADPPRTLRSSVAAAGRPVLLVAAGGMPDEGRAARWIRQGAPALVDVWVVPGAGHTDGLRTRPGEWERRVSAFLDRALA